MALTSTKMLVGEIIRRHYNLLLRDLFQKDQGIQEPFISFMKKKGRRWVENCEDPEFLLYCFITDPEGLQLDLSNFSLRDQKRMKSIVIDLRNDFISVPG